MLHINKLCESWPHVGNNMRTVSKLMLHSLVGHVDPGGMTNRSVWKITG
jgi:hypothetical protein